MEESSCLTGSGFGPPITPGAGELKDGKSGNGTGHEKVDGDDLISDAILVEESDCESLIAATPNPMPLAMEACSFGQKRRNREKSGSTESLGGGRAKRPAPAVHRQQNLLNSASSQAIETNLANVNLPVNATLQSAGSGRTILVKPQGPNAMTFLKDPIGLAKGIKNSPFGTVKDLIVRPNPRRQLVALESPSFSGQNIANYLTISAIGKWAVRCYQPGSDIRVHGVFGPIEPNVSVEEVMELACAGDIVISDIIRLTRFHNGNREPSATLKVTFQGQTLPKRVKIGYVSYQVRPFVPPALRCYRCQRLNHLAEGCNAPRRCLLCAGPHEHTVCTSTEKRCANCSGPHAANSTMCPFISKATAVEKLRATGRSYAQAVKEVNSNTQWKIPNQAVNRASHPQASVDVISDTSSSGVGLSNRVVTVDVHQSQGPCSVFSPTHAPLMSGNEVDSESQPAFKSVRKNGSDKCNKENSSVADLRKILKEELSSSEKRIDDTIRASLTGFSIKLGKFIHEVFKINLLNEGAKERSLLLISLLRNAFGREVSEVLQEEWLPASQVASDQELPLQGISSKTSELGAPQLKKSAGSELLGRLEVPIGSSSARSSQAAYKLGGQTRARGKGKSTRKQSQ